MRQPFGWRLFFCRRVMDTLERTDKEAEQAAKCKLAETVLRSFGTLRLRVTGCSMVPSLWPGDIILARRQDIRQVIPGTIVLFSRENKLVVHRAISRTGSPENPCVMTRGDSA